MLALKPGCFQISFADAVCVQGLEAKSLNLDPNEMATCQKHHFLAVPGIGQQMFATVSICGSYLLPLDGCVVLKYAAYEDQCLGAWVNL